MPRDLVEHVIEERNAGGELRVSAAVQVHAQRDGCLLGDALDPGGARSGSGGGGSGRHELATREASAESNASFSSDVPIVIRRQFASSGCQP